MSPSQQRNAGAPRRRFERAAQSSDGKRIHAGKMMVIVAFMGLLALGLYFLILKMNEPATESPQAAGPPIDTSVAGFDLVSNDAGGVIIHLKPTFIVNLAGVGGRYAMRVQIRLLLGNRTLVDYLNENPAVYYRMVDRFLAVLKSKTYAELSVGDGMDRLKLELLDLANSLLPGKHVERVIFNEVYFAELLPYARPLTN